VHELSFDDVEAYSVIDDIGWTPNSTCIITATKNGTPCVWDVESGQIANAALELINNNQEWSKQSINAFDIIDCEHSFPSAISAWQNILN